jgi:AcrR family transcriptional regulator
MSNPEPENPERSKRRRRTPESARRAILDAAGRRLTHDGPDGLRLQSIAADLGIAHSSILHHFGTREGLLTALSEDAFDALDRDLRRILESSSNGEDRAIGLLERVAQTLRDQGHARLLAWQIMSGRLPRSGVDSEAEASNAMLARIAGAVHRVRLEYAHERNLDVPELDDTRFFVLMMAYSLFGEALAGDVLTASAGFEASDEIRHRFRRWLGERSEEMIFPRGSPNQDVN